MGLKIWGSSCSCDEPQRIIHKRLPNPNPKNFNVVRTVTIGKYLVAQVNYPDCTNYEGNKVLVFKNVTLRKFAKLDTIDPHFCDKHLAPIARFVPTSEGWQMACNFVKLMYERER